MPETTRSASGSTRARSRPFALGRVEHLVGRIQRRFHRCLPGIGHGDSGGEGDVDARAFPNQFGETLAHPLRHHLGLADRHAGQQHAELFAAEAADGVVAPRGARA